MTATIISPGHNVQPFKFVRETIRDGDLLLFRRRSIISIAGRGEYSHAAMAGWWGDELMCLEMRELLGGRAVTLASQVRDRPRRTIDVYRPNLTRPQARAAMHAMRTKVGNPYDYGGILRAACLHLPVLRIFNQPDLRDDGDETHDPRRPEFCSAACANAYRQGAQVDPVPNLADNFTEPMDLARSAFFRYQVTLVWEADDATA